MRRCVLRNLDVHDTYMDNIMRWLLLSRGPALLLSPFCVTTVSGARSITPFCFTLWLLRHCNTCCLNLQKREHQGTLASGNDLDPKQLIDYALIVVPKVSSSL